MIQVTPIVKQLIIVNVIFFVASLFTPAMTEYLALYYVENPNFKIWQIVSHMFMHGSWMHLFFNMFALYTFGSTLEHYWGSYRFLTYYIIFGLGAGVLQLLVKYYLFQDSLAILVEHGFSVNEVYQTLANEHYVLEWEKVLSSEQLQNLMLGSYFGSMIGASGAIYGLLAAFAYMFPNAGLGLIFIPVPIPAKYFVPLILAFDLYAGLNGGSIFGSSTGIAHFAHLGGAITGLVVVYLWKRSQINKHRWN